MTQRKTREETYQSHSDNEIDVCLAVTATNNRNANRAFSYILRNTIIIKMKAISNVDASTCE